MAVAGSWLVAIVAYMLLVPLVPARLVVAALALGTTIGQTVVAVPLVFVTRKICGPAAVQVPAMRRWQGSPPAWQAPHGRHRQPRSTPASQADRRRFGSTAAGCTMIAFGIVAYILDDGDPKAVLPPLLFLFLFSDLGAGWGGSQWSWRDTFQPMCPWRIVQLATPSDCSLMSLREPAVWQTPDVVAAGR